MTLASPSGIRALTGIYLVHGFFCLVWWPGCAAALVAVGLGCAHLLHMAAWQWVIAAPFLYSIWMLLLLGFYSLETALLKSVLVKPRRQTASETTGIPLSLSLIFMLYFRLELLLSMPGGRLLKTLPVLRDLWHRAYSPSMHLGHLSMVCGIIYDPDITYIGRGALVGQETSLVGHSIVRQSNGDYLYHSAPIRVGRHASIGGGCRLEMGVEVGTGALIEPRSHLPAFTKVPAGEVWGGAPAVFRRKRDESSGSTQEPAELVGPTSVSLDAVCRVVAHALSLAPEEVNAETGAANCIAWDSVGKIAISAALHDSFGFFVEMEELFALDSIAAVIRAIEARQNLGQRKTVKLPVNAELLPLFDPAEATASLAEKLGHPVHAGATRLQISVAASFVAEPIGPTLKLWCAAFGIDADITFASFNQLHAVLLSPDSLFHHNQNGFNVLLTRPEDLMGEKPGDAAIAAEQLLSAIERFSSGSKCPLLAGDLPPPSSESCAERATEMESVRNLWRTRLTGLPRVSLLGFASLIEQRGVAASRNKMTEGEASRPYSAAIYQRLGIEITRFARQMCKPGKKVLALDADGVLWGGVVGEDGPMALRTDGPFRQMQQRFRAWKDRGVLLVLVSQNDPDDVWAAFEAHPEMPLGRHDFAAVAINWKSKSDNLRELSGNLNLSLDSFVFLDDSPAQQMKVQAGCPEVTVVPLPTDAVAAATMLERLWCFDSGATTDEDRHRTRLVHTEMERNFHASSIAHFEDYLHTLELFVEVRPAEHSELARVAQLIQKTNQFNLSLRRRTLDQVESLFEANPIWVAAARDRFGDYGLVGVGILERDEGSDATAVLETFLVSCRALGRGIEESFLRGLCLAARQDEATRLVAPYVEGSRNSIIRDFFLRQRWEQEGTSGFSMTIENLPEPPRHVQLEVNLIRTTA